MGFSGGADGVVPRFGRARNENDASRRLRKPLADTRAICFPKAVNPLSALLREKIAGRGPISFHDYMAAALYHPKHGFYSSGRAQIGRGGDFVTNVSVGSFFGVLLARQFVEMWQRLGEPRAWTVVEQGAHGGEFARDVLAALRGFAPRCFAATTYTIIEPLEGLRARQRALLQDSPVRWVQDLAELGNFVGVHFSNELLDAFPVHSVVKKEIDWRERYVACEGERFAFTEGPLSDTRLTSALAAFDVPPGFIAEINLAARDWLGLLARKMERGYVLIIDYGYTRAELVQRPAGTLSAYKAHRRQEDLLADPGEIDLTAHVDFTSAIEHAPELGLRVHGFTDQHRFLTGVSGLHFVEGAADPREVRAFKTLMHPELMGAAFKVLCLEKQLAGAAPLSGFRFSRSA